MGVPSSRKPCDHRSPRSSCGESIRSKHLRLHSKRDRGFNGVVKDKFGINLKFNKGYAVSHQQGKQSNKEVKVHHFMMKDGTHVSYTNKGPCTADTCRPEDCRNIRDGVPCSKNRNACDCPKHGHRVEIESGPGLGTKHRGPYDNPTESKRNSEETPAHGGHGSSPDSERSTGSSTTSFQGSNAAGEQVVQSSTVSGNGATEHILHVATKTEGMVTTMKTYQNESPVDSKIGNSRSYNEVVVFKGTPFQTVREGSAQLDKEQHCILDESVQTSKSHVELRPEVKAEALSALEAGGREARQTNEGKLFLTAEAKFAAIKESAQAVATHSAETVGTQLLHEFSGFNPKNQTLREHCTHAVGVADFIVDEGRIGAELAGGHSLAVGERIRTGEATHPDGSKVSSKQAETGLQVRVAVPKTRGLIGVGGNVGVTQSRTNQQLADGRQTYSVENLKGFKGGMDVVGVGIANLDTGILHRQTVEHKSTGLMTSVELQKHEQGCKVLGLEFSEHSNSKLSEKGLFHNRELSVNHREGVGSETTGYGIGDFKLLEVKKSGAIEGHTNPEQAHFREGAHTTEVHLGNGGHMALGAGAAGIVEGACDVLDGKGWGEAAQHAGAVARENLAETVAMECTGLPMVHLTDNHVQIVAPEGLCLGIGEETAQYKTLSGGHLSQHTSGVQLGMGDPFQVVQAQAAIGRTVDHTASKQETRTGWSTHEEVDTTDGAELQLTLGNRTTDPVRIGHVKSQAHDESVSVDETGAKSRTVVDSTTDGFSLGLLSVGSAEVFTETTRTTKEGVTSFTQEKFHAADARIQTGILNVHTQRGGFTEKSCTPSQEWTDSDGMKHSQASEEVFSGEQVHSDSSALFGLIHLGHHDVKTGVVHGTSQSTSSGEVTEDGCRVHTNHSEMTKYDGSKTVEYGQVASEDVHVEKQVQEHDQVDLGHGGTETHDTVSTYKGERHVDGDVRDEQGEWVTHENVHTAQGGVFHSTSDVNIETTANGDESGPAPATSDSCEVTGNQQHDVGWLTWSKEVFHIEDGEGQVHAQNLLWSSDVHGHMHYDKNSHEVVFDDPGQSTVTLSAPVNCTIAAVTSTALQCVVSKGYLDRQDLWQISKVGMTQFAFFSLIQAVADHLGWPFLSVGLVAGLWRAYTAMKTHWQSDISPFSKMCLMVTDLVGVLVDLGLYVVFATDPRLMIMIALSQYCRDIFGNLCDYWHGNLTSQMAWRNCVRSPHLAAAACAFVGTQTGLMCGLMLGPLSAGLGAAIGGALGSLLGALAAQAFWTWLWGAPMDRELQYAYSFLELEESAEDAEVLCAFRRKARELHPDKPGGTKEAFQLLQRHYEKICNSRITNTPDNSKKQRQLALEMSFAEDADALMAKKEI